MIISEKPLRTAKAPPEKQTPPGGGVCQQERERQLAEVHPRITRQQHLNASITGRLVTILQRLQRALHVAEVFQLAGIWRQQADDIRLRQQGIAFNLITADFKPEPPVSGAVRHNAVGLRKQDSPVFSTVLSGIRAVTGNSIHAEHKTCRESPTFAMGPFAMGYRCQALCRGQRCEQANCGAPPLASDPFPYQVWQLEFFGLFFAVTVATADYPVDYIKHTKRNSQALLDIAAHAANCYILAFSSTILISRKS